MDTPGTVCFDDAFKMEKIDNRLFLTFYIADVEAVVKNGTDFDRELSIGMKTQYFKKNVVPLMPDKLVNMFSLKQKEQKLVFALQFFID